MLENISIDDWGQKHAPSLVENIDTHIKVLAPELNSDEAYGLRRMIMITVRQWAQDKLKENLHGQPKKPRKEEGGKSSCSQESHGA
jgi:hypothetical protein